MSDQRIETLDLVTFCDVLTTAHPNVNAIHLFGSRRFGGGSLRSDIDLFVEVNGDVRPAELRALVARECPALDIFVLSRGIARSVINETYVQGDANADVLVSRNAICLWSVSDGFTKESSLLKQQYLSDIQYEMTALPNTVVGAPIDALKARLHSEGLPTDPILGETTEEIVNRLIETAKRIVAFTSRDFPNRRSEARSFAIQPASEYDLQDLFWISVKPWVANMEREAVEVRFNGQAKKSDFSFNASRIIIEMKFAATTDDKREIAKTLDGLGRFYSENANVTHVVFIIYAHSAAQIDCAAWQARYQKPYHLPVVRVEIVRVD
ncbi:hypothetical protein SLH49_18715 [Cognatiyoonia sp. IB215446]|uniref:PD-(D/E)XK nuclease domain-containing protein n=1 Tax=Cognatiyoonia sp. IB215446 TaxID=3097355 RepID=UPI002A14FD44|nr:hypothetical protein [Cognatiyoonia sp. IB215446]MDX8350027.1 hypothetical protein [Cognatiyoonia sp. IB215446]